MVRFPYSSTGRRKPRPTSCNLLFSLPLERSLAIVNTFGLSHPSFNVHLEKRKRRVFHVPSSCLNESNFFLLRSISSTSAAMASSESLLSFAKYPARQAERSFKLACRYSAYCSVFSCLNSSSKRSFRSLSKRSLNQAFSPWSSPLKEAMLSIKNKANVLILLSRWKSLRSVSKWRWMAKRIMCS